MLHRARQYLITLIQRERTNEQEVRLAFWMGVFLHEYVLSRLIYSWLTNFSEIWYAQAFPPLPVADSGPAADIDVLTSKIPLPDNTFLTGNFTHEGLNSFYAMLYLFSKRQAAHQWDDSLPSFTGSGGDWMQTDVMLPSAMMHYTELKRKMHNPSFPLSDTAIWNRLASLRKTTSKLQANPISVIRYNILAWYSTFSSSHASPN